MTAGEIADCLHADVRGQQHEGRGRLSCCARRSDAARSRPLAGHQPDHHDAGSRFDQAVRARKPHQRNGAGNDAGDDGHGKPRRTCQPSPIHASIRVRADERRGAGGRGERVSVHAALEGTSAARPRAECSRWFAQSVENVINVPPRASRPGGPEPGRGVVFRRDYGLPRWAARNGR